MNKKGQLSFDMVFAVMLVLIILIMAVDYNNVVAASSQEIRSSILLKSLSISLAGRINDFYIRAELLDTNIKMDIDLPEERMLGIDYILTIKGGSEEIAIQEVGGYGGQEFIFKQPLLFSPCASDITKREGGSLNIGVEDGSWDCS